jgi:hypothetical protein
VGKQNDYDQTIASLKDSFKQEIEAYDLRNIELVRLTNDLRQQIDKIHQDTRDDTENKKIQDKKQIQVLKDLKRQLNLEKKRADKLQEKLAELSIYGCNMNDMKLELNDDQSSVSRRSASYGRNGVDTASLSSFTNQQENTLISCSNCSPTSSIKNNPAIDGEHKQILDKLTQLQEANWKLEEKVNHLETANAAMAEDLVSKSSIISYYYLDRKTNNNSSTTNPAGSNFKSIVTDFLNQKTNTQYNNSSSGGALSAFLNNMGNSSESDDVKKLRRLLEETLTKNMHLEQVSLL